VRHTVADKLVEGIKVLNENRLVIVHNKDSTIAQAVYVPMDSNSFRINDQRQLEFTVQQEFHTIIDMKELDPELQELPEEDALSIDSSIRCFKVYVTGDLAFYALMLGKPNSSNNWCIWCQLQKKFFGTPEMVTDAVKWTLEKLKDAKRLFKNRSAKSQKNHKGVNADALIEIVEPENFIFPALHDQMGLVNKSLSHLLTYGERHVEKLPPEHTATREELLDAEKALSEKTEELLTFDNTKAVRLAELKRQRAADESKKEIEELVAEKAELDKELLNARQRKKNAKKKYDEMRKKRGKVEDSLAYQLDENLKKIGAKIEAYHGGDLNGGSSRAVMEKAKEFFEMMKTSLIDAKHDECELTDEQIKEMMHHYMLLYTELGSCFSYIHQILPSDEDLLYLKMSINNARKLWKDVLAISCTPKAHALFDGHAYEQHERLQGIGDKLEDFVEKGHQLGIRDERRTWNIKNWETMQRSQIRHSRRGSSAAILNHINNVHKSRKRKLKRLEDGGESLKEESKRVKKEEVMVKRATNREQVSALLSSA
jgi:hypothetical protein